MLDHLEAGLACKQRTCASQRGGTSAAQKAVLLAWLTWTCFVPRSSAVRSSSAVLTSATSGGPCAAGASCARVGATAAAAHRARATTRMLLQRGLQHFVRCRLIRPATGAWRRCRPASYHTGVGRSACMGTGRGGSRVTRAPAAEQPAAAPCKALRTHVPRPAQRRFGTTSGRCTAASSGLQAQRANG